MSRSVAHLERLARKRAKIRLPNLGHATKISENGSPVRMNSRGEHTRFRVRRGKDRSDKFLHAVRNSRAVELELRTTLGDSSVNRTLQMSGIAGLREAAHSSGRVQGVSVLFSVRARRDTRALTAFVLAPNRSHVSIHNAKRERRNGL